jgi:predicted alpha/beta hydrolase family esterase
MSRRAIIFHGTGGSPAYCWYRWLEKQLTERGYQVELPHLPGINTEPISTFLPKVLASQTVDEDTVLIGHSGGAALLLALLEQVTVRVPMAVLVAGYSTPPNDDEEPVLQSDYDWAAIRSHVEDIYFLNSVDDPYGCDDRQGRALFDRLGGTQIIRPEGHFETPTLELVDRLIP